MNTERITRIHEHAGRVALSIGDGPTRYLTGADARALARELIRYADSVGGRAFARHTHPVARVVSDGIATNESDGKRRARYLGAI